jgi:hypothetical protein
MIWTAVYQRGSDEAFTVVGDPGDILDLVAEARDLGKAFVALTGVLWDDPEDSDPDDDPVYVERTMWVDPAEVAAITQVRGSLRRKLLELAGR